MVFYPVFGLTSLANGAVVLIASSIIYFLLVRNPGQDPITEGLPVIPEPSS